jgi:hypothetical protein
VPGGGEELDEGWRGGERGDVRCRGRVDDGEDGEDAEEALVCVCGPAAEM